MTITSAEYDNLDAVGMAELVFRRQVSASELLDEALDRVATRNPRVNAVVSMFEGRARAAIAAGLPDGPFTGVPFLLKDLGVDVGGEITTSGSRFFADHRPTQSRELVLRYERAGLVIFGKTNTPEMGLNASTEPLLFGPTRNPWNLAHSAGGSSGGAAAAVAAGIIPAAHATDGGGSIRIPASSCGLFGMKPNRGRTPVGPPLGEGWNGLSHGHVVSRSVRDSAALLDATGGSRAGEPYAAPHFEGSCLDATKRSPGRLRIGMMTTGRPGVAVDDEARAAVGYAARLLVELGHDVVEYTLPIDWPATTSVFAALSGTHVAATIRERARVLGRDPTDDDLEHITRVQVARAASSSALDYVDAVRAMHRIGHEIAVAFEEIDVLMTPTAGRPPPPIGLLDMNTDDLASLGREAGRVANFLGIMNITGQPAMSVPLHWTADDLPMGVHFAGRWGAEPLLFSLAAQLELVAPWAHRRPKEFS
jgi:Asp-tRNA(Asn)/Glu-tRNA(Gln) amidotransferase A subunit family amidase